MHTYGLTQIIEEPTRITDTTYTLIDNILVNTPAKITQADVLSKALSDPDVIYCTRKHQVPKIGNTIQSLLDR